MAKWFWIIALVLSLPLANELGGQGKAFFTIYLILIFGFSLLISAIISLIGGAVGLSFVTNGISIGYIFLMAFGQGAVIFISWLIAKLFGFDMYVVYEIATFIVNIVSYFNSSDN